VLVAEGLAALDDRQPDAGDLVAEIGTLRPGKRLERRARCAGRADLGGRAVFQGSEQILDSDALAGVSTAAARLPAPVSQSLVALVALRAAGISV
jgi:hypothetical protein